MTQTATKLGVMKPSMGVIYHGYNSRQLPVLVAMMTVNYRTA